VGSEVRCDHVYGRNGVIQGNLETSELDGVGLLKWAESTGSMRWSWWVSAFNISDQALSKKIA